MQGLGHCTPILTAALFTKPKMEAAQMFINRKMDKQNVLSNIQWNSAHP